VKNSFMLEREREKDDRYLNTNEPWHLYLRIVAILAVAAT